MNTLDGRTEQQWIRDILDTYTTTTGPWTLRVLSATYGMVADVEIEATRKCGRTETFNVSRWPAGWRILKLGLDVPPNVLREAKRIGREVWPDE